MKSFPDDIKGCMKDCILSLFWAREKIREFFINAGCTASDIKRIKNFKEDNIARGAMVDYVFTSLSKRSDQGLGQFRAMLQMLINWSHFDPYYFDKLKKLDRAEAQKNIIHLKQLAEIRDSRIQEERKRREEQEAIRQSPQKTLEALKNRFLVLFNNNASVNEKQKRGYELEEILIELAKLSGFPISEPFRNQGEQIDGAFKFDGENYLLEAKWQDKATSNEPLLQFAGKTEGKMYGRGVFVSINGFSSDAVDLLVKGRVINTILVDGEDLILVFENHLSFAQMMDKKVAAAQKSGDIYIHPLTRKNKI